MTPRIRLKAFIGYQINSAFHASPDFRKMGDAVRSHVSRHRRAVQLDMEFGEFPPGVKLWDQVTETIRLSDITIFDISENNPNVLLEAGIAVGHGKHVILLKCKESLDKFPTPSDLRSFIYATYAQGGLREPTLIKDVGRSIDHFLSKSHDPLFYIRSLWSLSSISRTLVIPGHLPVKYTGNRFEDYVHLRNYGDLDALFVTLETLYRLYPNMDVDICSAQTIRDLPKGWSDANLVLVGGPDFNPLVREFDETIPIEYMYDGKEVWLKHKTTGREYRPRFYGDRSKQRAVDFGYFAKKSLNEGGANKIVFIGGARTWGVYGAAIVAGCISDRKDVISSRNARRLVEKLGTDPSFIVPVEVHGTVDGVQPPRWNVRDVEVLPND